MTPILEIQSISKKFALHREGVPYLSLRDKVMNFYKTKVAEDFWALKDINFTVQRGESLGIIGRNGAGKSTLLKILSRITPPTAGKIISRGRIASLLEVGTGFHQELTGRENIFMNGSILGMKRNEIKQKFDEIVEFAGTGNFLDMQLKHYSSGMQLRLAFAVAAHLEPEILIIDEVLAVGDAEFQRKCLKKMEDVSQEGRTVLFVSHNLQAVTSLTKRAIWINNGQIKSQGKTNDVISAYHNEFSNNNLEFVNKFDSDKPKVKKVTIFTSHPNNVHNQGESFRVRLTLTTPIAITNACISFQIRDDLDRNFLHAWLFDASPPICDKPGEHVLDCEIPKLRLYMGKYHLKIYFTGPPGGPIYDEVDYICPFEVVMYERPRRFEWQPDTTAYLEDWSWKIEQ